MKRIFVRRGSISADVTTAATSEKIAQARTAVTGAPDDRSKHRDLAKLLAAAGRLDELAEALDRWSTRDPLDAEVIMSRADLAARRGDRDGALRIMSGSLAATALSDKDAFTYASVVARDYERLGLREGCAFFVTAAELRPTDNEAIARAMTCERAAGHAPSAERWLTNADPAKRTAIASALAKVAAEKTETATGDIVVAASWEGGGDLDLAIVDPAGRRAAAVTRMRGVRVEGAQARDHETVALSSGDAGTFLVEVARATSGESLPPMTGKVTIRAFGQSQTIPFTLTGARTVVGRVDARWEAELVPVESGGIGTLPPFDRGAATRSLASISVAHCAAGGMFGSGHVTVTFSQEGRPSSSVVDDGLFAGSGSGRCVQAAFFGARVPPFAGAQVSVGRSFTISPEPMRPRD